MIRFLLIVMGLFSINISTFAQDIDPYITQMNSYFSSINNPKNQILSYFLISMPKGGDLHNHLVGAAYPKWLISYAQNDSTLSWCVDRTTFTATTKPICAQNHGILLNNTLQPSSADYEAIVNAWSMQGFPQGYNSPKESHDHFFAAFKKFTPLVSQYIVQLLADLMTQAAKEHINYLELMARTGDSSLIRTYSNYITTLPVDPNQLTQKNVTDAITQLEQHNFTTNVVNGSIIPSAQLLVDSTKKILQCNQPNPSSACQVAVEFQYAPSRNEPFAQLFTGLYAGMVAMQQSSTSENPNYIVGVNLVGAEDDPTALKYYDAQMKLIQYLKQAIFTQHSQGKINLSLHAGELTGDFVSPDNLIFHINDAINIAQTTRIGHGVDMINELTAHPGLVNQMQQNFDMVEINLTSNEQILWVCDNADEKLPKTSCKSPNQNSNTQYNHPFYAYLTSNIPVTISTDDQGVEQTDLTHEYKKAATRYNLTYSQLKDIDRNSLVYSFLPGQDIWAQKGNFINFVAACSNDNPYLEKVASSSCQTYLQNNVKAQTEWNLEEQFAQFEINMLPHSITTCQGLQNVSKNLAANYVLKNNLDCSTFGSFTPIDANNATGFTGIFDGQGYNINNLSLAHTNNIGLFGTTTDADIVNVNLVNESFMNGNDVGGLIGYSGPGTSVNNCSVNESVKPATLSGGNWVGGLIGENAGNVTNSYFTGTINFTGGGVRAGGLVANNIGNISNSYAKGAINNPGGGGIGPWGGLAGENSGSISNSYAQVNLSNLGGGGSGPVGGLVGQNNGSITNTYSVGSFSGYGAKSWGGLVGFGSSSATVNSSYWNEEISGQSSSAGGTPETTAAMYEQLTYSNWDLVHTWKIDPESYPKLIWQKP